MSDAMSQCIKDCIAQGKSQDQAIAICYSKLGSTKLADPNQSQPIPTDPNAQPSAPTPPKSKLQLLADFKKILEKNGYSIADDILEGLISSIQGGSATKKCSFKLSLSQNKKQTIQIFPKGNFYFEKYADTFNFDDKFFDEIINNFKSDKLFKPYIDNDHKLEEKYAEITNLEKKPDGLYAEIELNNLGLSAIENNNYSYISPQWGDRTDTSGKMYKNVLWAVTLTNVPAFEGTLKPLQDQIKLTKKEVKMDIKEKISLTIGQLGGYKLASDPNQGQPTIDPKALADAVSVLQEAVAKIAELTGQVQEAQDQNQQAQASMAMMKKEQEEKEKETFFEDALKAGKVEASEIENMKKLYSMDKDTVISTISLRKGKEDFQLTGTGSTISNKLTKEDYDIMDNLGYDKNDPKSVALYLKSQS